MQPSATSSIRTSPTRQPIGSMMLNRITTRTVNAACPAANEMAVGANPATNTVSGSSDHSDTGLVPSTSTSAAPTAKPMTVPQQRPGSGRPCRERGRAQHRQRAEHDPEAVADVGHLDEQDGGR